MRVNYVGNYETEIENTKVRTDRKGEIMAPSDMMALSVAACGMTVLALKAEKEKISFVNSYAEVSKETDIKEKFMLISLTIEYHLSKKYTEKEREMLENSVYNRCVVGRSIKDEVKKNYIFIYDLD